MTDNKEQQVDTQVREEEAEAEASARAAAESGSEDTVVEGGGDDDDESKADEFFDATSAGADKHEESAPVDKTQSEDELDSAAVSLANTSLADKESAQVGADDKHDEKSEGADEQPKDSGDAAEKAAVVSPPKEVIESGLVGTVKWYSVRRAYGFVNRTDTDEDVFVHQSAIAKSTMEKPWFRSLADGEKVTFDLVMGTKGTEAANVTGPDGAVVKGNRYATSRPPPWAVRVGRFIDGRPPPLYKRYYKEALPNRHYHPRVIRGGYYRPVAQVHDDQAEGSETVARRRLADRGSQHRRRPKEQAEEKDGTPSHTDSDEEKTEDAKPRPAARNRPRQSKRADSSNVEESVAQTDEATAPSGTRRGERRSRNRQQQRRQAAAAKVRGAAGDGPDVNANEVGGDAADDAPPPPLPNEQDEQAVAVTAE